MVSDVESSPESMKTKPDAPSHGVDYHKDEASYTDIWDQLHPSLKTALSLAFVRKPADIADLLPNIRVPTAELTRLSLSHPNCAGCKRLAGIGGQGEDGDCIG